MACSEFIQDAEVPVATITSFTPTLPILVHLLDELVDVGFPVTEVTSQDIVLEPAYPPATSWV